VKYLPETEEVGLSLVLERGQLNGTRDVGDLLTEQWLISKKRRVLGDLRRVDEEDKRR
jgi:hypothetical protein